MRLLRSQILLLFREFNPKISEFYKILDPFYPCILSVEQIYRCADISVPSPRDKEHLFRAGLELLFPVFRAGLDLLSPVFRAGLELLSHVFRAGLELLSPVFSAGLELLSPVFRAGLT